MRKSRLFGSLRFQVTLAISILVITAVTLLGLLATYLSQSVMAEEKHRLGVATAAILQRILAQPTPAEAAAGPDGLAQMARRVGSQFYDGRFDHSLTFFDLSYKIVWSSLPRERWPYAVVFSPPIGIARETADVNEVEDPATGSLVLVVNFPWKIGGAPVGSVQLVEPVIPPGSRFLFSGRLIVGFAAVYAAIVILFGVLLLNQTVIRPVRELDRAVSRLIAGERALSLPPMDSDELRQLAANFDRLTRQLAENEQSQSEQIEELLVVNEELAQTRNGLIRSEKLASVGRLAAGVAHEVGNPLAAILGYVDLLKKGGLDRETEKDFLARIEKDITRIHTIISGLLDYSRAKKERIEILDVNQLIAETIDLFQPQKQFKKIVFETASHLKPAPILADAHQIQQVLANFFLNASHAMNEEGAITVFVERVLYDPSATYRQSGGKFKPNQSLVAVSVIDQGQGMDEATQARIFDPFFTTKEPGKGTGLGLSVADKIVDSFGGTIDVSSQPGEGATFTMLLPEATENAAG
ncbi:MAG: HAMP domain-containing protein [Myxococcales bacterium]|nr:MAG: HAMP domain-containing protein [Myxococcales bacterium]